MSNQYHNISVAVRIRTPKEDGSVLADIGYNKNHIDAGNLQFTFPSSVVEGSEQMSNYTALTSNMIGTLNDGYSCTLIAYGQTGSGKTYTSKSTI
jgi:Cdc6-like AAA superfamily ATPase